MKLKLFFLSLISLSTVSVVQANAIFPFMITWSGILSVFGWSLILFGLVVEFICLRQFLDKTILQIIVLTGAINFLSALFGAFALIFFDMGFFRIFGLSRESYAAFTIGPIPGWNVVYGLAFFVGSVFINVIIEGIAVKMFVPTVSAKNMFFWLFIANTLSVGVGIGGLGIKWYSDGISPWEKSAQERKELFEKKYKVTYRKLRGGGVLKKVRKRK